MNRVICDDHWLERLMTNLRVLGKLGPGFKINTKGRYLKLDDTTYWQGVTRWYRGDSRDTMYEKVHTSVTSVNKLLTLLLEDIRVAPDIQNEFYGDCTPRVFMGILGDVLESAKLGLDNLKDTYENDPTLASRLEMDIANIKNQINIIQHNS